MAQSYHRSQRLPARTGQFTSAAYIRSLHILHPVATFELPAGRIHPLMFPAAWLTGNRAIKGMWGTRHAADLAGHGDPASGYEALSPQSRGL